MIIRKNEAKCAGGICPLEKGDFSTNSTATCQAFTICCNNYKTIYINIVSNKLKNGCRMSSKSILLHSDELKNEFDLSQMERRRKGNLRLMKLLIFYPERHNTPYIEERLDCGLLECQRFDIPYSYHFESSNHFIHRISNLLLISFTFSNRKL